MSDEVLAELKASGPRRFLGITMLLVLGGLLIYTAFVRPPAVIGWQIFLIGLGAFCLWAAERMRLATSLSVELTEAGLRSSDGEVIAAIEAILSVDRGMFVFKPSNGFIVRLDQAGRARWQPGLWWRLGRRVGIGGVTPGSQSKVMADMLAAMLLQRQGEGR